MRQADVPIEPEEDLCSRVLQWLHRGKGVRLLKATNQLSSVFPAGSSASDVIHIIISDPEGMLFYIFSLYISDSCQFRK